MKRNIVFSAFLLASTFINETYAQPVASFTVSRYKVCSGSEVLLTNNTIGNNTYEWIVNNMFHSGSFNDTVTLYQPCYDLQSIRLVAKDAVSGLADTMTQTVEVFDTCALHLTIDKNNCVGDTIIHKAHRESIARQWTITPATTLLNGCDTCDSVAFILAVLGTTVDVTHVYEGNCSQTTSYHYGMCMPFVTGVSEQNNSERITLFPNPVSDRLNIQIDANIKLRSIEFINAFGVVIMRKEGAVTSIDVAALPAGIYHLRLISSQGAYTRRIIKL